MPKIKTCRAAAKRFKKTGTGSLQESYLNQKISEEKKKSEKIYCC